MKRPIGDWIIMFGSIVYFLLPHVMFFSIIKDADFSYYTSYTWLSLAIVTITIYGGMVCSFLLLKKLSEDYS